MSDGLLMDQLGLISKAAFGFAAVLAGCFIVFLSLTAPPLTSYREASSYLFQTDIDLPWMMRTGALLILLSTALSLWLSRIYITHRAAGPLYRFSRNLDTALTHGTIPALSIRSNDHFQEDSRRLQHTAGRLASYEAQLMADCRHFISGLVAHRPDTATASEAALEHCQLRDSLSQLKATTAQGTVDAN